MPAHWKLRTVRADSGFFENALLTFRVFVTNRQGDGAELWRDYNQRACCEQHIEELKNDLQADGFCMQDFYATESAFLSVCFTYNLLSLYQHASALEQHRRSCRPSPPETSKQAANPRKNPAPLSQKSSNFGFRVKYWFNRPRSRWQKESWRTGLESYARSP